MKTRPPPGIPDDIFQALRKVVALERAVRRTRDQVRRTRVLNKKPAEAGSCASSLTTNQE